jgi:hypothetical protein
MSTLIMSKICPFSPALVFFCRILLMAEALDPFLYPKPIADLLSAGINY